MNIMILSGRFGMGHIKCAEAIKESLELKDDVQVTIIDFLDWIFPKSSNWIYNGFAMVVAKIPRIYNYLNMAAGRYGNAPLKKALVRKLDKLMAEYEPDMVISNIPISGKYLSAYQDVRKTTFPIYTYITDVTVHEEWISENTDKYFVGDSQTKRALIKKGISDSKIHVIGIPVKREFLEDEKVIRLGRKEKKNVLIMGGGLGMIPAGKNLLKTINEMNSLKATLIAGKNTKLKNMAEEKYPNIEVIGYTNKVAEYMKKADVIITKPGGITTFEAIASRTPLYIIEPFLEQEKGNAEFIEKNKIGYVRYQAGPNMGKELREFLENEEYILEMKENMKKLSNSFEKVNPLTFFDERRAEKWS